MHYRIQALSERLCCCMDVATGALLTGVYTCFLSLAFLAIGIDSLVESYRGAHNRADFATINAVYGILIGLSILLGVASISLVLGAARKLKTYVIIWVVVAPLWTIVAFCELIILPITVGHAVRLTSTAARICGTVFVIATNLFCMFCVCLFLATLLKSPAQKLRSLGVVEALESGFSNGYSRLRESIRPKSGSAGSGRGRQPAAAPVSLPEVSVSVVLDPSTLSGSRTNASYRAEHPDIDHNDHVTDAVDGYTQSLSTADELGRPTQPEGFVNIAFTNE